MVLNYVHIGTNDTTSRHHLLLQAGSDVVDMQTTQKTKYIRSEQIDNAFCEERLRYVVNRKRMEKNGAKQQNLKVCGLHIQGSFCYRVPNT